MPNARDQSSSPHILLSKEKKLKVSAEESKAEDKILAAREMIHHVGVFDLSLI